LLYIGLASHVGGVVVLLDIEFANWARVRFLQPLVNALRVEEVQAWHCAHFFGHSVLAQAHEARRQPLIIGLRVIIDFVLAQLANRQLLHNLAGSVLCMLV